MTAILYIVPLITRLFANTKKKSQSMSFYNLLPFRCSVFFSREIVCQTDAVLLLPLRCFPLLLFLTFLPRLEITVFTKNIKVNVKLILTSGIGVVFSCKK